MTAFFNLLILFCCSEPPPWPPQVVDQAGMPISGAAVEVIEVAEQVDSWRVLMPAFMYTTTDAMGRVTGLPASGLLELRIDHPDFAPWVELVDDSPQRWVVLQAGRRWPGRVGVAGENPSFIGKACASWNTPAPRGEHFSHSWTRCATLEQDGSFELRGLDLTTFQLRVSAPGFLPLRRTVQGEMHQALLLERGILINGRTIAATGGKPLAEVEVRNAAGGRVLTDQEGYFALPVASLPTQLRASATGFRAQTHELLADSAAQAQVVRLQRGEQLTCLVLAADGTPIERLIAWVTRFRDDGESTSQQRHQETEEGRLTLDLDGAGHYSLRLLAAGYREVTLNQPWIATGSSVDLGTIVLDRGAGLSALLADARDGEPVVGARAEILPIGAALLDALRLRHVDHAVSDRQGHLDIGGLEAGRYQLRIKRQGFAELTLPLALEESVIKDLGRLWMDTGTTIHGLVSRRDEQPVGGALIEIFDSVADAVVPILEHLTDQEGRFGGSSLAAGDYRVKITKGRLLLAQEIHITAGTSEQELTFQVSGTQVNGRVSRRGEPVSRGLITLRPVIDPSEQLGKHFLNVKGAGEISVGVPDSSPIADVLADGTFHIADIQPGWWLFSFFGIDAGSVSRRVLVQDRDSVQIHLELAGAALVGTVTSSATGLGLEASVRLLDDFGKLISQLSSDYEGSFVFQHLQPGTYALEAFAPGFAAQVTKGVMVKQGGAPVQLVLAAGGGGEVQVVLRRGAGLSAASVPISLLRASGPLAQAGLSDAQGKRRFRNVPAGTYAMAWSDSVGGAGASPFFAVGEAREPIRLAFELRPSSVLRLDCKPSLCGGRRLDLLTLHTSDGVDLAPFLSAASLQLRFSADGALTLGRLAPGTYRLSTVLDSGELWQEVFHTGGPVTTVRLP